MTTPNDYNKLMKQYDDRYYVLKNTDGVYVLVNHPAWSVLKGRLHDGAEVHIESYSSDGKKLLLTMTKGSVRLFNNRLKSVSKTVFNSNYSLTDDGGFLVFDSKYIHEVAEAFGIKKRPKKKLLSEDEKIRLKERLQRKSL